MTSREPTWAELDQALDLLAAIAAAQPGARERALLSGAAELFQGNVSLLFRARLQPAGVSPVTAHDFGMDAAGRARLDSYVAAGGEDDPTIQPSVVRALARVGSVVASTRQDLIDDDAFYAHPHVTDLRQSLGLDQCLHVTLCFDAQRVMNLTVHRPTGAPAFTAEERRLAQSIGAAAFPLIGWPALPRGGILRTSAGEVLDLRPLGVDADFGELSERLGLSPAERALAEGLRTGLTDEALSEHLGGEEGERLRTRIEELQVKLHAEDRAELVARLST